MTGNHEDAEDALQETFLHAYLALPSFEGRSQFASWLTRIAINSALMVLRRRRSRPEVSFELSSESGNPVATGVRDHALNPEQLYDLKQRSDCTMRAISRLSTNLRTPITTWVEQDCTVKELARTLDLSLPTVKARLYRARKQLACTSPYKVRAGNTGSISGSKQQYAITAFQNRELPCPSCD
jgi:RNA polymerase sigma-70 factor (ECF subfamily)